jgi:acyl-CoA synthetase (NDP forming)
MKYLEENGIPCIFAPGRTVHALGALAEFAEKKRRYDQKPAAAPRPVARQNIDLPKNGTLGEYAAKRVLAQYGIPVVGEQLLAPDAVEKLTAAPFPFPLAIKVESADVPHKTEAGAVKLGIASLEALKAAAREVVANAKRYKPDARIDGVIVQQMATGQEVIVGAVNDPFFGPVITLGLGGILTELMHDVTHRFAPFDARVGREMIADLKSAPLFTGYRGKPALDVDALADALARLSLLATDHADRLAEIDINPLFVGTAGKGVVAADALIVTR